MPTSPNANPTLPSPVAAFRTDPDLDRVERIAAAEQALLELYGANHVPVRCTDGTYVVQYFAREIDAKMQRRWAARAIVEREIIEERRQETLMAMTRRGPTAREIAERQREMLEATGMLTSGWPEVA
jgi:DNA invertase Pin-like site-specific DNA recombinase